VSTSNTTLTGGVWSPNDAAVWDSLEVLYTPALYTYVADADLASGSPPTTPRASVVNVFSGSKAITDAAYGCHYKQWPGSGSPNVVTHSIARTHDYNGGSVSWRARWSQIETSAGVFDWTLLDNFVTYHRAAGRDILHTLFATPNFYSARPAEASSYGLGNAAEPSDLAKWDTFCAACATRYGTDIGYYEVWNEPNLTGFWTGTKAKLSEMTRRANQAIKAIVPTAKIVSAPVTGLYSGTGITYLSDMLSTSDGAAGVMSDWIDIIGVHLYPDGTPNDFTLFKIPDMIASVRSTMTTKGVSSLPLWNTELTCLSPTFSGMSAEKRARFIRRCLVLSLLNNNGGCDKTIFYGADDTNFVFSSEDAAEWERIRGILAQTVTVVNIVQGSYLYVVAGGNHYVL